MNQSRAFDIDGAAPRWLTILREHSYDVARIADPKIRQDVVKAAQRSGIELLKGSRYAAR